MRLVGWSVATMEGSDPVEVLSRYDDTALFGPFSMFWLRLPHTSNFIAGQSLSACVHLSDYSI
jgi:hypothetical protein